MPPECRRRHRSYRTALCKASPAAGAGGGTWGTVLTCSPLLRSRSVLTADILIHPFNNSKGVGLLALAFALEANKGLALLVSNAGNSDNLQLVTFDGDGKILPLKVVSLGAGIKQDLWYRLTMSVSLSFCAATFNGGSRCLVTVTGNVHEHVIPTDPDSPLGAPVGTLTFADELDFTSQKGQVGIVARAISAAVDSSVTNFCVGSNI